MRNCRICNEPYFPGGELEPTEPCLCGEGAYTSPWKWDHFKGVKNWLLYKLAAKCFWLGNTLIARGYK